MEKPSDPERKSPLEIGADLANTLEVVYQSYRNGTATLQDLLSILNDIQRLSYNRLREQNPDHFVADYDKVAVSSLSRDNYLYTLLLEEHPVIKEFLKTIEEQATFPSYFELFKKNYPEVVLPTEGTPSDIFKATLRHLLHDYGQQLQPETISTITLQYLLKPSITFSDYLTAEQAIANDYTK